MSEPSPKDVLVAMVNVLQPYIPAPVGGLPTPSLSIAQAEVRAAGIGNYIGMSTGGGLATSEQHAVQVQAVVRFSLWGADPVTVDQAVTDLNAAVFAKRRDLQAQGFLKLTFDGTAASEQFTAPAAWRRHADYHVLYEFAYEDTGGASSLIVRIPVEETASGEQWAVTGDVTRWGDDGAPLLSVRGPAAVVGLAALAFFPDAMNQPTGSVRIVRTFDGAPAPVDAGTPGGFLMTVTASGAPARNVYVEFTTLRTMLTIFKPDGSPIDLGDGVPGPYVPMRFPLEPPIVLPTLADRLEISYQQQAFDGVGVIYLRAERRGG